MRNKTIQRSGQVLRYVRKQPHVTAKNLRVALPLTPREIQRTLGVLWRRKYVLRDAARGHYTYTITASGEAWLRESAPSLLTAEHTQLLDKYRLLAEQLELRGFWHRAARQWLHAIDLSADDDSRIVAVACRERCYRMLS